jgi:hypothetical protein
VGAHPTPYLELEACTQGYPIYRIPIVLTIMSDLDPHMISGYGFGMVLSEHTSLCDKTTFFCSCEPLFFVDNLTKIGFGRSTHLVK